MLRVFYKLKKAKGSLPRCVSTLRFYVRLCCMLLCFWGNDWGTLVGSNQGNYFQKAWWKRVSHQTIFFLIDKFELNSILKMNQKFYEITNKFNYSNSGILLTSFNRLPTQRAFQKISDSFNYLKQVS